MIDWDKLLIKTVELDTEELLGNWSWLLGRPYHPLVMSKFGDWFLADDQGQVHWLDLLEGRIELIAESVEEFQRQMMLPEKLEQWFCDAWCYALHDAGLIPKKGQCFGFKIPPRLGASVDLSNVEVADLAAYQLWMAQISQIPPGTSVDAITINGKLP